MRESNIMKICKGMDVTPFELFQTDKKVLVINDPTVNIDHQLQRTSDMRYIIETTKTHALTRVLLITEDVAQMFQAIIEDRNALKVENP